MEKEKISKGWGSEITAGCVIPGTNILYVDKVEDVMGQVREIRLLIVDSKIEIVLTFWHFKRETVGTLSVLDMGENLWHVRGLAVTRLHPNDFYLASRGARIASKRLLYCAGKKMLGADPKTVHRAVRMIVPEPDFVISMNIESDKIPDILKATAEDLAEFNKGKDVEDNIQNLCESVLEVYKEKTPA